MDTGLIILIVFITLGVLLAVYAIGVYNQLVSQKNRLQNAFAQIEVQLKRRYDLIPNLVETAKGYLKHEQQTLTQVVEARNQANESLKQASQNPNAQSLAHLNGAEQMLGSAMGRFNLLVEAYPDLKANTNMSQLSEEMTATENKVAFARQAFNNQVMTYNTYKQSFPPVLFASLFGHQEDGQMLEFADSEAIQQAPSVKF